MGGHAFQARRALDLAALTARLKPCPSTTARIPAFFRSRESRASTQEPRWQATSKAADRSVRATRASPAPPKNRVGKQLQRLRTGVSAPHKECRRYTDSVSPVPPKSNATRLFRERFFVHHVGHLGDVAAVVSFQHVNQSLHSASSHTFVWIFG